MEFSCRAVGSRIGPNRSTDSPQLKWFLLFQIDLPGRSKKSHFGTGKDCVSVILVILRSPAPPRKIIWSRFSQYLSDFKLRSLFCALLEIEKTLLCVVEMRKEPFRVRRPGARMALFPRRNLRSALPREKSFFAFSLKRFPGSSVSMRGRFSRGPEFPEIEHLLV